MYVIIRNSDGKYVTPDGSEHSYTSKLESARIFPTRESTERHRCENEHVVDVMRLLQLPGR